jgi:uncharacterized membrane protein YbhN (UPF0104 family)
MRSRSLRLIATWVAVLGVAIYVWSLRDEITSLKFEHGELVGLLFASVALNVGTSIALTHLLIVRHEPRIELRESAALTVLATLMNAFSPARAGAAYRALHMRRRYGMRLSTFGSTVLAYAVVTYFLSLLLALSGLIRLGRDDLQTMLLLPSGLLLGGAAVISLTYFGDRTLKGRIFGRFPGAGSLLRFLTNQRLLIMLGTLGLLHILSGALALWSSMAALGTTLPLAETAVIASAGVIATLVAITPGAFGIFEGVLILTAAAVSTVPESIVLGSALLQRLALVTTVGALSPLASAHLRNLDRPSGDELLQR